MIGFKPRMEIWIYNRDVKITENFERKCLDCDRVVLNFFTKLRIIRNNVFNFEAA